MGTNPVKTFNAEKLNVVIGEDRPAVGKLSAQHVSKIIRQLLEKQDEVRIVFAAAPSQNEFLDELSKDSTVDWSKVVALHMDEYIGLPENSDKSFGVYLTEHFYGKVKLKKVYLINSHAHEYEVECKRYEALLKVRPIDIVFLGIGENGHIAFNDPPYADFNDTEWVKIIKLDDKDKAQQVNDAGFKSVNEVPSTAYTLTIPSLMSAKYLSAVVPGVRKAEAVRNTLTAKISEECPATILRTHPNVTLFIDKDSASLLNNK
jgi:glucosamine-6-phosphate deaminase